RRKPSENSKCKPSENSKCQPSKNLKLKHLKVVDFCAKKAQIKDLKVKNLITSNIVTDKLIVNGFDVECRLSTPPVIVSKFSYDCMVDGVPQKPDNINQDVWDVLTCNREHYQAALQEDFLAGREEIRCIKKAYGCPAECPPDCPIVDTPGCPTSCPEFPNNCELVPAQCIPDWKTCSLEIENKLYATLTLPYVFKTEDPCAVDQTSAAGVRFIGNLSYNLDITNITCNLGTRVSTVLMHFAYLGSEPVGPTEPTGCQGPTGATGLACFDECTINKEAVCGVLRVNCRQYYYTININLGENFSNVINIPSNIIKAMADAAPKPINFNDLTGAFQMAIFIEDGLEVSNNAGARDPPSTNNDDNSNATLFYNPATGF
ncbi:MAG: hypothetical protein H0U27_09765, partial [Nitrosopumilus sp.]|nr:hypothetical protein [Nitrosopumilus sp.]